MCMVYSMHNLIFYNELISDLKVIAKFVMYSNIKHLDLLVMYDNLYLKVYFCIIVYYFMLSNTYFQKLTTKYLNGPKSSSI